MKVHFIGSLEGNKKDYAKILACIKKAGWEVLSDHSVSRSLADVEKETPQESELYARKMQRWIREADVIIVEATMPVLGTGFEIATSLQMEKSVIVLYRPTLANTPHVLRGVQSDKLQVIAYDDNTLVENLDIALEFAKEHVDIRFNFFISPAISNYLDWITAHEKTPRSVYLRKLIEQDMKKNKRYLK